MPISEAQVAKLRARELATLQASGWVCVLERPVALEPQQNDMGEQVEADEPTTLGPYPCRLVATPSATGREREREALAGIGLLTSYQIVLPWDTEVVSTDRIRITQPTPERLFEIQQIAGPKTHAVRLQVFVEEAS